MSLLLFLMMSTTSAATRKKQDAKARHAAQEDAPPAARARRFPGGSPQRRRLLFVYDPAKEAEDLPGHLDATALWSQPTSVKNPPVLLRRLKKDGLLEHGNLLVQDPFDPSRYYRAQEAADKIALRRCERFSHMCGLLGAQQVTVITGSRETGQARTQRKKNAELLGFGAGASHDDQLKTALERELKLDDKFQAGTPSFDELDRFLTDGERREHHDFIEQCKHGRLREREIEIQLSTETQEWAGILENLKLKLKHPFFAAAHEQMTSLAQHVSTRVTIKVLFPTRRAGASLDARSGAVPSRDGGTRSTRVRTRRSRSR